MSTELATSESPPALLRCCACKRLLSSDHFFRRADVSRGFKYQCKLCTDYDGKSDVVFDGNDTRLDVAPVIDVVQSLIPKFGSVSAIARDIRVSRRSLSSMMLGYSIKHGKKYPVKGISLAKVDYILMSLGSSIEEAYGDV